MDTLGQKLPTNPAYWEQIVLDQLTQQSPELANTMITAEIKEADYPKGNATGYIVAAKGNAIIPLVIREFRLKPFSVVLNKDTVKALTRRTVGEILFSPEFMSDKTVDPRQLQVYNDVSRLLSPPETATSGYGEARQVNKSAGVLAALRVASNKTKVKVASALEKDEELLSACARLLPFESIMGELQKVSAVTKQASDESKHIYIKRYNGSGYSVNGVIKAASDLPELEEHEKSALLLRGEVLVPGANTDAAITVLGNNMKVLKDKCAANVACADGSVLKGVYIPRVMSFHGGITGQGLFLSPESLWCYQENIAGMPLGDDIPISLTKDCPPRMGDYGVFIHKVKLHALEPFMVTAIYHVGGSMIMAINTMSGKRAAVEYSKDSDWDGELASISGAEVSKYFPVSKLYKVGSIYKYVALGQRKTAARSPEEATGRDVDHGCVLSIKLSVDRGFILGMNNKNSQPMTKLACQAVLLDCGLSIKQAEMLTRRAPVSFVFKPCKSAETLANRHPGALQEDYTDIDYGQGGPLRTNDDGGTDSGGELDSNLLSAGAQLNDPDILDSLLTIGMTEVDNEVLAYVASSTGNIEELIDKLGRMLLVASTTETDLPEDMLRDLIYKLDKLIWKIRDYTNKHELVGQADTE